MKRTNNRVKRIVEVILVEGSYAVPNKQWYWRIKGGNGEILCHSEMYNTKFHCLKMATSFYDVLKKSMKTRLVVGE